MANFAKKVLHFRNPAKTVLIILFRGDVLFFGGGGVVGGAQNRMVGAELQRA